jgi:hypothetical protein
MQMFQMSAKSNPEGAAPVQRKARRVLPWCLPALLGFVAFFFAFPIDRQISFWPHLNFAELFGIWFLFVTPATTTVAIVMFIMQVRQRHLTQTSKWLLLAAMIVAILLNLFILFGLYAATA